MIFVLKMYCFETALFGVVIIKLFHTFFFLAFIVCKQRLFTLQYFKMSFLIQIIHRLDWLTE